MKTTTLLIVFVVGFLTLSLSAQETIWFDSNWNVTTKDKAFHYRPAPKKMDKGYWIVDYYLNGVKQMEGLSTTNEPNKEMYIGTVNYFHENGNRFQEVFYVDGKPEGKFSEFYDSGELKTSGRYKEGKREGAWKTFNKNGKIKEKGRYNKGEKVGIWKVFYKNE